MCNFYIERDNCEWTSDNQYKKTDATDDRQNKPTTTITGIPKNHRHPRFPPLSEKINHGTDARLICLFQAPLPGMVKVKYQERIYKVSVQPKMIH